jgi:hypothetical protein
MCRAIVKPPTPRSPMRPFKRARLAAALTLVSFQLLAASAQSQDGTKPGPRERVVEDTRAAPYIADQRPEIADEASQPRSVLGIQVRTKTEEAMGRIIDLLADRDGKVVAAVIEFGGFLGIGTRKIAVEWSALRIEADKSPVAILDVTREQLRVTPEYKPDRPAAVFKVNQPAAPTAEESEPIAKPTSPVRVPEDPRL